MAHKHKISIVIPAFNEEENISPLLKEIQRHIPAELEYEIIFVDDGSTDNTLEVIKEIARNREAVKYLSFSRNFGHQPALIAGLDHSSGDCVISMDADLQHPPELIPVLIEKWQEGNEVVYTVRKDDKKIGLLKRITSVLFYRLLNFLGDIKLNPGSADFRLLDAKVVNILKNLPERNIFLRGIISWLGFRQTYLEYKVGKRYSGSSKYSFRKMVSFGINGITSFSIKPLRISIYLGITISLLSFIYVVYVLIIHFTKDNVVLGWPSTMASILLIGGLQLSMIGIIGEYIGKLFIQSKERPKYIINETNIIDE